MPCSWRNEAARPSRSALRVGTLAKVRCAWLGCGLAALLASASARAAPPGAVAVEAAPAPEAEPVRVSDAEAEASRVLAIDSIAILGREQVTEEQIERILADEGLEAGSTLLWPEDVRVERAQARLRGTGYFKRALLRVEPVADSRERVVLVVDVVERGTITVDQLYLGTSRLTPFRGGIALAERNFLGRGVHLGGAIVWGTLPDLERGRRQQSYKLFGEAPRLGKAKLGVLGSAYVVSASEPYRVAGAEDDPSPSLFRPIDYTRVGGLVGLTFPVLPEFTLGVDYRFERVNARAPEALVYVDPNGNARPVDVQLRPGQHRLTTAHFGLVWDGRDELFLVGSGGRVALDLQISSPALGSDYEYIKIVAAGAYSIRLPWRHWITPRVSGGQIAGAAPRFELFYAGDLSSWTPGREQGLRYSTRNPIDVFGTGIDTRTFGVLFGRLDLEYVWPLFRRTRTRTLYGGDLFLSAGIFTLVEDRRRRRQRSRAGQTVSPLGFNADFGLRLDTSFGTFNVSVGNILRRVPL